MNIGQSIKKYRCMRGLTQAQLSDMLHISTQAVSKWENSVSSPDINMLPQIAKCLMVSTDELFGLSTEVKLVRVANLMKSGEELPVDVFKGCENYLKDQLNVYEDKRRINSLLACLYSQRRIYDANRVAEYAKPAIVSNPELEDCHGYLNEAIGRHSRNWLASNHSDIIDFYKCLVNTNDVTNPIISYYYLIDNLIADHRTKEAQYYLEIIEGRPDFCQYMLYIYRAYIALAGFDVHTADSIINEGCQEFKENARFLFEVAQYYAEKCDFEKAICFFNTSYDCLNDKDSLLAREALQCIAKIRNIVGGESTVEYYKMIQTSK